MIDLFGSLGDLVEYLNDPAVQMYAGLLWQLLQALVVSAGAAWGAVRAVPVAWRGAGRAVQATTFPARWLYRQAYPPPPPPPAPVPPTAEQQQQAELLAAILADVADAYALDASELLGHKVAVALCKGAPTAVRLDGAPVDEAVLGKDGWATLTVAITDRILAIERMMREAEERSRADALAQRRASLLALTRKG